MASYELPTLVDQLLDVMIQVSNADKGFLVLMESGEPVVKVGAQPAARDHLRRRQPALRLDPGARHQDAGSRSSSPTRSTTRRSRTRCSVVNLKLTSVMCVPLLERGNMLGVIYVGNDNVAQLFDAAAPGGAHDLRGAGLAAGAQRAAGQRAQARQPLAAGAHRADPLRRDPRLVRRACRRSSARSRRSRPPTSRCSSPARPAPARS